MRERLLLGPGPGNCPPEVLEALGRPTLGHLDPSFLSLMDGVQIGLRRLLRTRNPLTIPVSGTGSAGMEALLVNLLEPGDRLVVAVNGVFGARAADLGRRLGARVEEIDFPWGRPVDPAEVARVLSRERAKAFFFVHAETSTGALSDAATLTATAREHGALVLMDCVTSLAGLPVEVDGWGVDGAFSGTQKCLSAPPGLAPLTLGPRAVEALRARSRPVSSWYFDLTMVERYWGPERTYHHTAPVNMIYALDAAIRLVEREGLEARWERHADAHRALAAGFSALGLDLLPPSGARLPMLNAVLIPAGIDAARVRSRLLDEFGIEVGAGLGELRGKVLRIGLMGHNATRDNVVRFLEAFERCLVDAGHSAALGCAVHAAERSAEGS